MGIEKMSLISVDGPAKALDAALMACCESGCFHIVSNGAVARNLGEQNPYANIYARVRDMAINLKIPARNADFAGVECETAEDFERTCATLKVIRRTTRPYTPQTNGLVERFNGRIGSEALGIIEQLLSGFRAA